MYKIILLPLDLTTADATILAHIRPLARLCVAQLHLVHVADRCAPRYRDQLNLADSPEIMADREHLAQRQAELAADGVSAAIHLAYGDPATEILRIARELNCDLIAMATHGHRFMTDVILGTVAEEVRHRTDIPVLLVRARAEAKL